MRSEGRRWSARACEDGRAERRRRSASARVLADAVEGRGLLVLGDGDERARERCGLFVLTEAPQRDDLVEHRAARVVSARAQAELGLAQERERLRHVLAA